MRIEIHGNRSEGKTTLMNKIIHAISDEYNIVKSHEFEYVESICVKRKPNKDQLLELIQKKLYDYSAETGKSPHCIFLGEKEWETLANYDATKKYTMIIFNYPAYKVDVETFLFVG